MAGLRFTRGVGGMNGSEGMNVSHVRRDREISPGETGDGQFKRGQLEINSDSRIGN